MKIATTVPATMLLLSALLGACDEPDDSRGDDEETPDGGSDIDWEDFNRDDGGPATPADAGSDAATRDAGPAPSNDAGVATIEEGGDCPAQTGPGTTHSRNVTSAETWTAESSPHYVTSSFYVQGTLTIEACARVILSKGVSITIGTSNQPGGKLITQGTYEPETKDKPEVIRPVIFDSANDGEFWSGLAVWYQGEAELNTTVLIHGGDLVSGSDGALSARGPNDGSLQRMIHANVVLVLESGGYGISLGNGAGFYETATSAASVLGSGRQPKPAGTSRNAIYPVYVQPPGVGTLPPGEYYGSTEQEFAPNDKIFVYSSRAVTVDEQFHDRGVPYLLEGTFYMRPTTASKLTIDPGVELQFRRDPTYAARYGMTLGDGAPIDRRPVAIDIQGTPEKPIVFTSDAPVPAAGDWSGLYLDYSPAAGNKLSYAKVLYAGGESSTSSYGCGPKDNDAAILITDWRPDDAFIQHVEIGDSAAGGIVSGWTSNLAGPDLKTGNTFRGIANGCAVSRWRTEEVDYCPGRTDEAPLCL